MVGSNAETSQAYNSTTGTVTTTFDANNFIIASDLSVARTILHESIHAYIVAFLRTDYPVAEKTFADMLKGYYDNKYPNSNDAHHNEFARNYANDIALALQEYGSMLGYNLSSQFYQDMAWGGLTHWAKKDASGNEVKDASGNIMYKETPWFKAAYPNSIDRDRVKNTIKIELTGKDTNGNTKPKQGNSAGCYCFCILCFHSLCLLWKQNPDLGQ